MLAFEKTGPANTEETLKLASSAAKERGYDIVFATTRGGTALRMLELAKEMGYTGNLVAVTHVYGFMKPGTNTLPEETRKYLNDNGVKTVTAAHALSGAERGISKVFQGVYPAELMAATLRMIGQGVKVAVEIALMATDNGAVEYGKPVVCVAGSGSGADTCCIITPSYTASLLETKVHEILCKPSLM